jgi:hypothetical protein
MAELHETGGGCGALENGSVSQPPTRAASPTLADVEGITIAQRRNSYWE